MSLARPLALALMLSLGSMAQAQPAKVFIPSYEKYFPAPEIRAGDVPRPCATKGGLRAASSGMPENIGRYRSLLRFWGDLHFKFQGGCTDFDYVVSRWQETVRNPVTGVLGPADVKAMDEFITRAEPQVLQERERFYAPLNAEAGAARMLEQGLVAAAPQWAIDLLPPGPVDQRQQCHPRIGAVMGQLLQERRRIESSPEVQQLPVGNARVQRIRELTEQFLSAQRQVDPQWVALWAEQPLMLDWAERYECRAELRFQVELWQQALGGRPDAMDPSLVADTRQRIAAAVARHASEQAQADQAWARAQRQSGVGRTLVLDRVDGGTPLSTLVSQMPTDRCQAGADALRCGPRPSCDAEQGAVAQAQADRQRERDTSPRPAIGFSAGRLSPQVQMRLRSSEQALRRCRMDLGADSQVLLAGQQVQQLSVLAQAGSQGCRVTSMELVVAGDLQRVRHLLSQRLGEPQAQSVVENAVVPLFVPGRTAYVPGAGTVTTQGRVEVEPVKQRSTQYAWSQKSTLVEEHKGRLKFSFGAQP